MASGQKIAKTIVDKRSQIPFVHWLKSKLFAVFRQDTTAPPGPMTPDGKCVFRDPNRYADEMSARDQPPPKIPGGVNHRIFGNAYFDRDARRTAKPVPVIYDSANKDAKFQSVKGEPISSDEMDFINKGPEVNFGLDAPTPGTGLTWRRNKKDELHTQQKSTDLSYIQKFDRYMRSN